MTRIFIILFKKK